MTQDFANFSSVEKGFEGYLKTLENNFPEAHKALTDNSMSITDFAKGLQNGNLGAYATDPKYVEKLESMFKSVVQDLKNEINSQITDNNTAILNTLKDKKNYRKDGNFSVEAFHKIANMSMQNEELNKKLEELKTIK